MSAATLAVAPSFQGQRIATVAWPGSSLIQGQKRTCTKQMYQLGFDLRLGRNLEQLYVDVDRAWSELGL